MSKCCSDRKKSTGVLEKCDVQIESHSQAAIRIQAMTRGAVARRQVNLLRCQFGMGDPTDTAGELRNSVDPGTVIICVVGSTELQDLGSEELLAAVAARLAASLGESAAFVTRGRPGADTAFTKHCGDGERVWHLVPLKAKSGLSAGMDIQTGTDKAKCGEIFCKVGDIYLTVEGDAEVAQVARTGFEGGAVVLPLVRTGGASGGLFDFPPEALQKPEFVADEAWETLGNKEAPTEMVAEAVATIVGAFVQARAEALQAFVEVEAARLATATRWKTAAKAIRMARSCTNAFHGGAFRVEDAVGEEAAAEAIDEEFDTVAAQWKPSGARGGAVKAGSAAADRQGLEAPRASADAVSAPATRETQAAPKIKPSLPPPQQTNFAGDAKAHADEIAEMKRRMAEKLDVVHGKVMTASTKLQAVERGRQARSQCKSLRTGHGAPAGDPAAAGAGEVPPVAAGEAEPLAQAEQEQG